jgi:hypothetical protein
MDSSEILTSVLDYNNEMSLKIAILVTLFIYSCLMYYFSKLEDEDRQAKIFFKIFFMRIPSQTILFLFPLFLAFLYRDVSASILYGFIVGFYGVYSTLLFIVCIIWGTDFIMGLWGSGLGNFKSLKKTYRRIQRR